MGRAQHSITQLFHFPDVLGKPASLIGSEFPKSWYRAPALRSAPSRCPKPSLALTPAAVGLMYAYTNNRGRAVGADLAGAIRVLSGRGYADFHAGANFAITEFCEVQVLFVLWGTYLFVGQEYAAFVAWHCSLHATHIGVGC